ncbi:MAG: HD domain-containing protein [Chloroflexi bacterium]|nr:HD domain-containing protein [Chloroflexota bacterium]
MGIVYRSWQFWQALSASPSADELEFVHAMLTDEQYRLFNQMQPSEQAHSIKVARYLIKHNCQYPDLIIAALLHDIGKINHLLKLWERVWLVIGNTFFPKVVSRWLRNVDFGNRKPNFYQRVFFIHNQHPLWGAKLAEETGSTPLCVNLIRRHHEKNYPKNQTTEDQFLYYLQEADNLS